MKRILDAAMEAVATEGEFMRGLESTPIMPGDPSISGQDMGYDEDPEYGFLVTENGDGTGSVVVVRIDSDVEDAYVVTAQKTLENAGSAMDGIDMDKWLMNPEYKAWVGDPQLVEGSTWLFGPYNGVGIVQLASMLARA